MPDLSTIPGLGDIVPQQPKKSRGLGCALWLALLGGGLGALVAFVAVFTVIWPGSLKLTAPLVCDDGFDTAVVVSDSYSVRPGESSTSFTLYCMNPRGEIQDAGSLLPAAIITGFVLVWALAIGSFVVALRMFVRRRRPQV